MVGISTWLGAEIWNYSSCGSSRCSVLTHGTGKWPESKNGKIAEVGTLHKPFCFVWGQFSSFFFFFFLVLVAQLCPALCDLMDCSLPGSSIHWILQTRILEWLASPFSRGSSQPRDQTQSPALWADSLPSGRLRCKKREEVNYPLVLRFELIFSIIPSVPSQNGLLETQLSWVSTLPNHSI